MIYTRAYAGFVFLLWKFACFKTESWTLELNFYMRQFGAFKVRFNQIWYWKNVKQDYFNNNIDIVRSSIGIDISTRRGRWFVDLPPVLIWGIIVYLSFLLSLIFRAIVLIVECNDSGSGW